MFVMLDLLGQAPDFSKQCKSCCQDIHNSVFRELIHNQMATSHISC